MSDYKVALFSDVRNFTYSECETIKVKFDGWKRFFLEASLPNAITTTLSSRIDEIIRATEERKKEIIEVVKEIDEEFAEAISLEDLHQIRKSIVSVRVGDLPEEMDAHLLEIMQMIDEVEVRVQKLPQSIDGLTSFIEDKTNINRTVVLHEAKLLKDRLMENQKEWVNNNIIPLKESTMLDAQKCILWLERLREIPAYVDAKTIRQSQDATDLVTKWLHNCRVQGVLSLYNSLTIEEKEEFIRLITR